MQGDLHTHTDFSDGSIPIEKLPRMAAAAGLTHIAITDHDTFLSCDYAMENPHQAGITLIPGIEISAWDVKRGRKVHVLCFAPRRTEALEQHFLRMAESRNRQQKGSIEKLVRLYPFIDAGDVEMLAAKSGVIFKAHIMRTLREYALTDAIYGDLYRKLLGRNGLCRTGESYREPVENILRWAHEANAVVVLAHPGVYDSMELACELARDGMIDGVEIDHPGNSAEVREQLRRLAQEYGLIVTGGTDYHGMNSDRVCPVGECCTDSLQLQRLITLIEKRSGLKLC